MTILYVLVPLGLVLCLVAVWAFFWAVNTGQFEELDAASVSPLEDDLRPRSGHDDPDFPVPAPSAPGGPPSA
ncbi:MAG: cbb3-type cytochrome oxidase assembly protein CcoS [Chromatiales bacterium]|nr:cbb3-type cytochrome oxidase assembly protein CcoS [Chromatiales bacterium]